MLEIEETWLVSINFRILRILIYSRNTFKQDIDTKNKREISINIINK